jgi:excisionase family DNA binding protein
MLRQITTSGTFETSDPATARLILDSANEAEQKALAKIYSVNELALRLGLSVRRTYDLLTNGKIRYACAGIKNYRVSEQAVREYLGDLRAAA